MSKVLKCGVCKGKKKVVATFAVTVRQEGIVVSNRRRRKITCPSCKGTGKAPGG